MLWEQQIEFASLSDVGMRRKNNQDSFATIVESERENWLRNGHLFIVADGMGGHAVGDLASKIAVDTMPLTYRKQRDLPMADALKQAMEASNAAIYERGKLNREFERMGTTCSALVLGPLGALIGHVGDSRVYRLRNGQVDQLTFDHSLQWELIRRGQGSAEEIFLHQPRHVITRSMGPEPTVAIDIEGPYPVFPGDVYLICSDGLTGHVSDEELGAVLQELPPAEAVRFLVNLANLRGGTDNITVTAVRVGKIPEGAVAEELPIPLPSGSELTPLALGIAWGVAAFFCLGATLILMQRYLGGVVIAGLSVLAAAILIMKWMRDRPPRVPSSTGHSTVLWRPYRTASAKVTHKLLHNLLAPQANLLQAAEEEGWDFDRAEFARACEQAEASVAQKNYRSALREYSRAINVLMSGVSKAKRRGGLQKDAKSSRLPPG